METFAQAIGGWHDFYLMTGTAAATLLGLLFVSLSLNVAAISQQANADLRLVAAQTFTNFLSVVLFAVVFLIPHQVPMGLGLPLLGIGFYLSYSTVRNAMQARRMPARAWGRGSVTRRFVMPAVCSAALLIIGATVPMGQTDGLYWLVPVMILLIVAATRNAWDLLLLMRGPRART